MGFSPGPHALGGPVLAKCATVKKRGGKKRKKEQKKEGKMKEKKTKKEVGELAKQQK